MLISISWLGNSPLKHVWLTAGVFLDKAQYCGVKLNDQDIGLVGAKPDLQKLQLERILINYLFFHAMVFKMEQFHTFYIFWNIY